MRQLQRYNDPFAGLTSLHSQLDDIFNNMLSPALSTARPAVPAMDVYTEEGKRLNAEVQAPGFTPEDIEITVNNGVLEIKGEKHEKDEPEDKGNGEGRRDYMVRESHASFYRSIVLPKHADTDSISADFKDGVLKVSVPFKELPEPKRIQIGTDKRK
jgi:HSP20 family protein